MEETFRKNDIVFSKSVRAGKRTYFFDVRETKGGDYYLTITESKRHMKQEGEGGPFYLRRKLFLYKEDFEKFNWGLTEAIDYVKKNKGIPAERQPGEHRPSQPNREGAPPDKFTDVNFEELDK